jgi:predicted metallo-beta-lactamase superfamily hydrolase
VTIALQIASLRARCVARRDRNRAVQILIDAGVAFARAVRYVLQAIGAMA